MVNSLHFNARCNNIKLLYLGNEIQPLRFKSREYRTSTVKVCHNTSLYDLSFNIYNNPLNIKSLRHNTLFEIGIEL